MARLHFRPRRPPDTGTVLLLALGAVAGATLGVLIARRLRDDAEARTVRRGRARGATSGFAAEPADDGSPDKAEPDEAEPDEAEPDEAEPDEAELEARVLAVFQNDPTLRDRAIDICAVGDGGIELTGWVERETEATYATTLARGVPDVRHVVDHLTAHETDGSRVGKAPADR
jgi:hypothetical protein